MDEDAIWYFDYLSPFPYLQLARFGELPDGLRIKPTPVLFAAMLNHWGHKGPAEIPAKKRQTYFYSCWLAEQRNLPFAGPPHHPFNPLAVLRLTIAAGSGIDCVRMIYERIWGEGANPESPETLARLAAELGIADAQVVLVDHKVKETLRVNTQQAIAAGVFGVPTFLCDGELFWGDDSTSLFLAFLKDREMFRRDPYLRLGQISASAERVAGVAKTTA